MTANTQPDTSLRLPCIAVTRAALQTLDLATLTDEGVDLLLTDLRLLRGDLQDADRRVENEIRRRHV
jgi:hypothetical protein